MPFFFEIAASPSTLRRFARFHFRRRHDCHVAGRSVRYYADFHLFTLSIPRHATPDALRGVLRYEFRHAAADA